MEDKLIQDIREVIHQISHGQLTEVTEDFEQKLADYVRESSDSPYNGSDIVISFWNLIHDIIQLDF